MLQRLSITEEMQNIARNILCDVINLCETIDEQAYEISSMRAASAAKSLSTTLSRGDLTRLTMFWIIICTKSKAAG